MSDAAAAKPVPNVISSAAQSGGAGVDAASSHPLVGAHSVARGDRLLLCLSALSRLRQRASDHGAVRAVARSCARLCRHHHARPCRILRHRRLYGRDAGLLRHLDRADRGLAVRRFGGRRNRLRFGPGFAAHQGAHAPDADALRHGAAGTGRQHGARHYGRFRRPEFYYCAGVRPVRIQSAVREHPISLHARRPAWSASLSCARWSTRRSAKA